MLIPDLDGKRIAILGTGREARSAYQWLGVKIPGLALTLIDESPPTEDFEKCLRDGDQLIVEPFTATRLCAFDVLIRSPGISPYRKALSEAKQNGVRITTSSSLWFAAHPDAKTICITGTKGKSTTSAMLAHILQSCGFEVQLAGNIGQPLLACSEKPVDWWVVELSSYQISDLEAAPDIAAILNLSPEHLDWHGNEANYRKDKLKIAELVKDGRLFVNASDGEMSSRFDSTDGVKWFDSRDGVHVQEKRLFHGKAALPVNMPDSLPGRHNLLNAVAALTLAEAAGADLQTAATAIATFKSLPHRLQVLGQRNGIVYINDSISSTPLATAAALEALCDQALVLILGGLDRGIDWSPYIRDFHRWPPRAVIGIPSSGAKIVECLEQAGVSPSRGYHLARDLREAVDIARELAAEGDTVLLSPGAPSFPQFIDFQDRGRAFSGFCGFDD